MSSDEDPSLGSRLFETIHPPHLPLLRDLKGTNPIPEIDVNLRLKVNPNKKASTKKEEKKLKVLENQMTSLSFQEKLRFIGIDPYSGFMGLYFSYFGESLQDCILWTVQYACGNTDHRVILYLWMVMVLLMSLTWALNIAIIRLRHDYLMDTEKSRSELRSMAKKKPPPLVGRMNGNSTSTSTQKEKEKEDEDDENMGIQDIAEEDTSEVLDIHVNVGNLFFEDKLQSSTSRLSQEQEEERILRTTTGIHVFFNGYYWRKACLQHYQILIFSSWVLLFSYYNFVTYQTIIFFYSGDHLRRFITGLFRMFSFALLFIAAFMYHYGNDQHRKDSLFLRNWKKKND